MEVFPSLSLSLAEKAAFKEYLRERYNYSESTIKYLFKYLKVTATKTQGSTAKARWARRKYEEFKKIKGGGNGI